ncbi:MAG: right-handed parallel beta-helix repeat-containing protein, partial [Candidatus Eisenbacteria bacterium]|nr:right-handed parallel beta-helix repeat-containing protein [Candidatus Eisenbacteria bacterium]
YKRQRPDGSGDYPDIQSAIATAVDGDTVCLGSGVYRGPGNVGFSYGGREILVHSESGSPADCVIDCEQDNTGVFFESYEGPGAILDGVTIKNGRGTQAGGIWIYHANPIIRNCILEANLCVPGVGGGGVLACGSQAWIVDCVFRNNSCEFGGGGFCSCSSGLPRIERCVFEGNTASSLFASAGAICCQICPVELIDCLIVGNRANYGAGAILAAECAPTIRQCTIAANSGDPVGGVFAAVGALPFLENTIIAINEGQALFCDQADARLACTDLWGNGGGDWIGCITEQLGLDGNIGVDPLFCSPDGGDFRLRSDSPCAAENNDECGQIGRFGVGCTAPTMTVTTSWGRFRAGFGRR